LDLRTAELRRSGEPPQKLSDQPFQILAMLLEHSGDLVTRDEIRNSLWPNGTIVEFEHSINAAINRLRLALGDSAEDPHFIETLARRGYRWMSPVQWSEAVAVELSSPDVPPSGPEPFASRLIGRRVSHYRVLQILGGGGMGVVYNAEDLKLGRRVALKFLPEELTGDPIALKRFEQEARAASALNHRNICTIYEVEEHAGQPFIVMELLEGETVRELISASAFGKAPLEFSKLLDLAIQITDGLEAAHRQGIIHRDIKPANIFVTAHGQVKILDFGLAKLVFDVTPGEVPVKSEQRALAGEPSSQDNSATPGPEPLLSHSGATMGTAGYMSPEQVRGEKLDPRTDLFSFGLVLYEIATGRRAFAGDTAQELHRTILNQPAMPARQLNPELPPEFEKIINRALEKDREVRYQSTAEMRVDLMRLIEMGRPALAAASSPSHPAHRKTLTTRRWPIFAMGAVVLLALLLTSVFLYLQQRRANRLTAKDTIVLADFANSTGEPIFDDTLKRALRVSLQQSPFLNILSDRKVGQTLEVMARSVNTPLTPQVARDVCQRASSKAYIVGAIASLGGDYVLELKAVNCRNGEILARQQFTVDGKDKVLNALGTAATKVREELGESLLTVGKFDVPLEQQTTPSLEALREYNYAMKAGDADTAGQLPHFLRAIQLDPTFAMAYLSTAESYANLNQGGRASEYFTKAFELRDHADAREKLEIESLYYAYVTGELDKAAQTYRKTIESYPGKSPAPYGNLGIVYSQLGQYEKALELARQVLQLMPSFGGEAYEGIAEDLLPLQRFNDAHQILQTAVNRKLDIDGIHKDLYALGFLEGDLQAMASQSELLKSKPEYSNLGFSLESDTAAYRGRLNQARALTRQAVDSGVRADNGEAAALWLGNAALREALFGNGVKAHQYAAEALKLLPASQHVEIEAALAFALSGDKGRAEALAKDLGKRFPLDSQIQSLWLPTIDAQLALMRGKPADAIDRLQTATPLELGSIPFSTNVSCLYAIYVRGQALLAASKGSSAAAEFQKILDHNGVVWNCPTGALAHLGLARSNALDARASQGIAAEAARTRSLAAYRDFFALWQDADPDIPILIAAKSEFAKLK
jgi:serine/threonine protein kinase/tetratricopeptide (TPR) repeat protein